MKKRLLLYLISLIVSVFCISCKTSNDKGVSYDEKSFNEYKEKWSASEVKNYSFTYDWSTFMPSEIIGNVKVVDGNGTVEFIKKNEEIPLDKDFKYPEEGSLYYITCMEDLFNHIDEVYKTAKKSVDYGKYEYIQIRVDYDSEFGYPKYTQESRIDGTDRSNLDGYYDGHYVLRINDFKIN